VLLIIAEDMGSELRTAGNEAVVVEQSLNIQIEALPKRIRSCL
jgi:hypothetical protein